jgi:chorismate dehydratase
MTDITNKIRVGRIDFTNVWPIFYQFPLDQMKQQVEMIKQVPTGLNKAMAAGEVDMGPISSFAYGQSFEDYVLYPDLSVSTFGAVKSILLFHEKPLEEIANGSIALPTTSATSVHLLKIIMQKFYGGLPEYSYAPPVLEEMIRGKDAALLIGDDAIRAEWRNNKKYRITDLGQEWAKWTGEWMSFAVWAIRKDTIERYPEWVKRIFHGFVHSKNETLAHPEEMIKDAQRTIGGTEAYWLDYFNNLCYDFGPQQWKGLQLYYRYAWELGFLPKQVSLQIWSENRVEQVTE